MILDPRTRHAEEDSPLVAEIAAEVRAVCGAHVDMDGGQIRELARAVAQYVQQQGAGEAVDSQFLMLLSSQALNAIGEQRAARRLLLLGSGLVRPAVWEVTGRATVWTLDLKRMAVRGDAPLEMILFKGLQIVLDSIADVWDESGGSGVLGLRHVCTAVAEVVGERGRKHSGRLADEILELCRDKLARMGSERGWETAPEVLNLDLEPA